MKIENFKIEIPDGYEVVESGPVNLNDLVYRRSVSRFVLAERLHNYDVTMFLCVVRKAPKEQKSRCYCWACLTARQILSAADYELYIRKVEALSNFDA